MISYAAYMTKGEKNQGFKEVSSYVDSDALEREVLEYWEKEGVFEKSLEQNKDKEQFTFYDGPPYATGKPHYGHVLQSAIKDTVLRYKTMRGYYVPRRVGWDTHGLPIENIVEKELGIKEKKEIEKDIEGFNAKCRETVFRYVDEFTATLKRMGRWADYENAYSTLDRDYMESEWWVFRQLWDKELVYKAFRSTPYCTRCATPLSNFEVNMAYKDKFDAAVYVTLPIEGKDNLSLLVWTTTPWTLPANVAVAYGEDVEYVTAEIDGKAFVIAKDRVTKVLGDQTEITRTWKSSELEALKYVPLYETEGAGDSEKSYGLVAGDHVTAEDGTGLVHMAPAFGEEDAEVGKKHGLPVVRTVDTDGKFVVGSDSRWEGKHVFDSNELISADLKDRGLLYKEEQYKHSYPHCWRCDTPLIYYALDTWFVKVQEIKDGMLKNNEKISWIPEHVKEGRFKKGIESAPDWAVSRNRYWSVPVPVWECDQEDCEERVCVGSVEELRELSGVSETEVKDLHRPYVDDIMWDCKECKGTMKRIEEVLDVWFDSGSMPYAQSHYPFENKELVDSGFPADFIVESIEMTRAWFYVLHVLAVAVKDRPAYRNVIASGIIFGEDGNKLSKKLKNYPEIDPTIETYGADIMRIYFLSSTLGQPFRFSERDLKKYKQKLYITLWNVYSFFTRYANVHGWTPGDEVKSSNLLDQWILARTAQLESEVIKEADSYHIDKAARHFMVFVDDLSNWYVRRSRDRFQQGASEEEKAEAFGTLHDVLVRVSRLIAPFMPFVAEEMYRNLVNEDSVHLETLGDVTGLNENESRSLEMMGAAREIVSEGLALRAKEGIKVRQPLTELVVAAESLPEELAAIVVDEVNVKGLKFKDLPEGKGYVVSDEKAKTHVALKTTLTDELKAEGAAREVIRYGQTLRRKAEFELDDRITVVLKTDDEELKAMLESQRDVITEALQADEIVEEGDEDAEDDVKIGEADMHIGVKK